MIDRRDLIRTLALASLAAGTPGLLAACSEDGGSSGGGGGGGGGAEPGDLRLVSADVPRSDGLADAVPDVTAALQRLAGRLYGELSSGDGNLALSPYSIAVALAMTVNGAGGETAQEMLDVLNAPPANARAGSYLTVGRYNGGLNALTKELEGLAGPKKRADGSEAEIALDAANQLFGQHDTPWTKAFLAVLAREYAAGMRTVDFAAATEAARTAINDWTAKQTHDRIPEIIPPRVLDALTRLVLVNAIYLKAPWETEFEQSLTRPRPFHGTGETFDVDTMTGHPPAHVTSGDGWRAARIPYAGRELAMTIVLPDEGRLGEVEAAMTEGGLAEMLAEGQLAELDLRLPKWKFRSDSPLKDVLAALGMPTAFDPQRADFLGMTDDDLQLFIKAVLHQAFIAVDEEGTEAAAATAVVVNDVSAPLYQPFHVDRPFHFAIHDVAHGTPLFLGRVVDPR